MLTITIKQKEFEVLRDHTSISSRFIRDFEKLFANNNKQVRYEITKKGLDRIIYAIADKANRKDSPRNVKQQLDNMFARFADQYNNYEGER